MNCNYTNFLNTLAVSKTTLVNYKSTLRTFEAFRDTTKNVSIDVAVKEYLATYKSGTAKSKLSLLKRYLKFTYQHDLHIKAPKSKESAKIFEVSEIDAIVQTTKNRDLADMLILISETGMRTGEALALKAGDIKDEVLKINKTVRAFGDFGGTKTGVDREIYMSPKALETMKARIERLQLKAEEYIWSSKTKRPYKSTKRWSSALRIACAKLGIEPKRLYSLRHMYASKFINLDINNVKTVAYQLGHTNIKTTLEYYYQNNSSVESVKNMHVNTKEGVNNANIFQACGI